MEEKKPWRERLKQDIVIIVVGLLLLGGSASFLSRSPYFVPGVALFLILSFGPYVIDFIKEKYTQKDVPKKQKLIVKRIKVGDQGKVWIERKMIE